MSNLTTLVGRYFYYHLAGLVDVKQKKTISECNLKSSKIPRSHSKCRKKTNQLDKVTKINL